MARDRSYTANFNKSWPIARQEAVLGVKGVRYQDVLKKAQLDELTPDMLLDRARMLAATSRQEPETIRVASLPCLAINLPDLCKVLVAAGDRPATIVAVADGIEIPPGADFALFERVALAFQRAKRGGGSVEGRVKGWIKAVEKRNADIERRIDLIRDDYKRREHKDADLLMRAGKDGKPLSRNAAIKHLGKRKDAQKEGDSEQRKLAEHQDYIKRKDAKHAERN